MRGSDSHFHSIAAPLRRPLNLRLRTVAVRVLPALADLDLPQMYPIEALRGLLTPSRQCVGSAATLLMLETGLNTSPTISLPWSQVLPTDDPRWLSIANWKERANGTLIEEDLPVSRSGEPTSAGSALLKLREMAARHRLFVGTADPDRLLVFDHAAGHVGEADAPCVASMTTCSFKIAFDAICLSAFGTYPVPIPSGIRPSLLMVLRGHSPSVRQAQAAAGHRSPDTTSGHYAGRARAAHHADHMIAIRAFQERLERIAIHNLQPEEPQTVSGESAERLDDAIKTGLGVLCIRPPVPEASDPLSGCLSLENCPNCRKLRLATTPEDLADLLAFGEHLASHEDWLQAHRPEAWKTRWLFWSLLIDEVVQRGTRSVWAPNLKKARELLASRSTPTFPPLW